MTGLGSILALVISKAWETRAHIQQDLRTKKPPVYEKIVKTLFRVVFAEKIGEKRPDERELVRFFAEATEQLTIWGSDQLVGAFSEFRSGAISDPQETIFAFERLLLAIRKDLGHNNQNLGRGDILRLFVNDIDLHLRRPMQGKVTGTSA